MFDRYVADTRPSWKRRSWFLVSLAMHAIGGGAVLWVSLHVVKAAADEIQVRFVKTVAPPPPQMLPPPTTEPPKPKTDRPKSTQPVRRLVQPIAVPTAPPKTIPKRPGDDEESWDTGGPSTCPPGTICTIDTKLTPTAPTTTAPPVASAPPKPRGLDAYTRVSKAPARISGAEEPDIPADLLPELKGSNGVVLARIRINVTGGVDSVDIASSTLPSLNTVVKRHIQNNWRFAAPSSPVEYLQPFAFSF